MNIDKIMKEIKDKIKEWEQLQEIEREKYKELGNEDYDYRIWCSIDWTKWWLEMALEIISKHLPVQHEVDKLNIPCICYVCWKEITIWTSVVQWDINQPRFKCNWICRNLE
jgi:hypothetical protein